MAFRLFLPRPGLNVMTEGYQFLCHSAIFNWHNTLIPKIKANPLALLCCAHFRPSFDTTYPYVVSPGQAEQPDAQRVPRVYAVSCTQITCSTANSLPRDPGPASTAVAHHNSHFFGAPDGCRRKLCTNHRFMFPSSISSSRARLGLSSVS